MKAAEKPLRKGAARQITVPADSGANIPSAVPPVSTRTPAIALATVAGFRCFVGNAVILRIVSRMKELGTTGTYVASDA
jgi:hypothetical protein